MDQQLDNLPHRPSIIKSSMTRTMPKKSVTFASVFDLTDDRDYEVRIYEIIILFQIGQIFSLES